MFDMIKHFKILQSNHLFSFWKNGCFYVGSILSTSYMKVQGIWELPRKWTHTSLVAVASMCLWEYSLENLLFFLSKILLWIKIGNVRFFLQARKALNANQKERGRKFPQSEAPEQV